MARILVSGLINIETTLQISTFPLDHSNAVIYPFFGIHQGVAGAGYQIARALTLLDDQVRFLSLIGRDLAGQQVRASLAADHIPDSDVLELVAQTAQSVILYDRQGRRQTYVDLKDIQKQVFPEDVFDQAIVGCDLAVLSNINFSRPFLFKTRKMGKMVATDVQAISSLEDEYNQDFLRAAHILFMSDELLPVPVDQWARQVMETFPCELLVIGMGARGAYLAVRADHSFERIPAVPVRQVINTQGAGDALFAAFVHSYMRSRDPYEAIRKAVLFADYKIGAASAADGLLDHRGLEELFQQWESRW